MINELLESFNLSRSEYYEALRLVVADELKEVSVEELEYEVNGALENMTIEEVEEFFGAIASLVPSVIRGVGGLIRGASRRRRRRRRRPRRRPRRIRNVRSGLTQMLKMARDPRFLSLIAGNLLNRTSGRRIGRTRVRRVRRKGSRREVTEVTLNEFLGLFSFLNNRFGRGSTGFSRSVANEAAGFGSSINDQSEAEAILQTLYGDEVIEEFSFENDNDEFDGNEGFEDFDEFAGLENMGEFDAFDSF